MRVNAEGMVWVLGGGGVAFECGLFNHGDGHMLFRVDQEGELHAQDHAWVDDGSYQRIDEQRSARKFRDEQQGSAQPLDFCGGSRLDRNRDDGEPA